ncbi:MAG: IclR family transcriptional regulator [Acidimicrobiales bacterium]
MGEQSKTVDKALALLLAVGDGAPAPIGDLARRVGLSRTATSRLLTSLERPGFVRRTGDGYTLGLAVLRLSDQIKPRLRQAARPALESLASEFGETALLAVRDGFDAVAVDQVLGSAHRVMQVRYRPGHRHPLTVAAHGRAILAFLPEPSRAAVLTDLEPNAARHIEAELATARRQGFVRSSGELEPGAVGVAAPIVDHDGVAVASIGVVAPDHRLADLTGLGAAVRHAAQSVRPSVRVTQGGS